VVVVARRGGESKRKLVAAFEQESLLASAWFGVHGVSCFALGFMTLLQYMS
jgi:hypothetical protein